MTTKSGGPAFPEMRELVKSTDRYPHYRVQGSEGMTLRDYFAAKALQAIIQTDGPNTNATYDDTDARRAYKYADAMLKARDE